MRIRFHDHGNIRRPLREVVEEKTRLIEERLQNIEDDLKSLDVTVEHHMRSDSYTTRLLLQARGDKLYATNHAKELGESARGAFDDIYDQLDVYLAKLRREPDIRDERRKPAWLPEPSLPVDWERWKEPKS
jgi:ribosome-associated translation inhibitor RaiA